MNQTEQNMLCSLPLKNINSSTFYQIKRNDTIPVYDICAGVNIALFGICTISVILTCWRFNSITVLNIRVRPTAISNILWVFYFSILGFRSLILGIFYIIDDEDNINKSPLKTIPKILFPAENFFKILELLFLSWALEYQRKHRSKGFIQDEIEQFNDRTEESANTCRYFKKILKTIYNIFTAQAVLCLVFLIAFTVFLLKENNDKIEEYLYWTFNGCVWSLCLSGVVLMIIIVVRRTIDEGPSTLTKVLLFFGVILTLPADIPLFIWHQCIFEQDPSPFICYVTSQALLIIAVVFFMAVLIREFQRLKEEAQWNVIDQAESYYNITESM